MINRRGFFWGGVSSLLIDERTSVLLGKKVGYLSDYAHWADPWWAALNFLDVVLIQPGDYSRDAPIHIPHGKVLCAWGVVLSFKLSANLMRDNISCIACDPGVSIFGLTVKCAPGNFSNAFGISVGSFSYYESVVVSGASNTGWNIFECIDVTLKKCRSLGNRVGVYISNSKKVSVLEHYSCHNSGEGLLVQEGSSSDLIIDRGDYSHNGDSGISVGAWNGGGVVGNIVASNNLHQGIELQSVTGWTCVGVDCRNNSQCGILISDYYRGAPSHFIVVSGFVCSYNGEAGIQVAGSSNVELKSGILHDNARLNFHRYADLQIVRNIQTGVACSQVVVSDVLVDNLFLAKLNRVPIFIHPSSVGGVVFNNVGVNKNLN